MICIVGASLAGDTAAAALRAEGYSGPILLIGDEPEAPYDRPPLSKEALFDDTPEERLFLRAESWYEEQGIELKLGNAVTAIDPAAHSLTLANGESITYDKLLIATGARARSLPDADTAGIPVFLVRTLEDARGLKAALTPGKRVAIVGAGVIGLEVAASARKLGCEVEVVDLADRVLSRVVPPALSAYMAKLHEDNGVRLHLSAGGASIIPGGIRTEKYGDIAADVIVIGIGVIPNTEIAVDAGLDVEDGIVVDEHCRTSAPNIYAVGDASRYPDPFGPGTRRCENWKHAQNHATTAAKNMIGQQEAYAAASSMWSDQFDVKLQTVGRLAETGGIVRGEYGSRKFMLLYVDDKGVVVGALGVNNAKDMRFAQVLIEKRLAIDPALLADPKADLRKLAA